MIGLMAGHMRTQHGWVMEGRRSWAPTPPCEEPQTYRMAFLNAGGPQNCEDCPGRDAIRTAMRVHFLHRRVQDTVIILEEGNIPHPRCPQCDMMVPWQALNRRHLATTQCARGAERKRKRLAEEELWEISERAFQAYGAPLEHVAEFNYLGRVMMAVDDDWPEVAGIPQKVRKSWGRMSRILRREGG